MGCISHIPALPSPQVPQTIGEPSLLKYLISQTTYSLTREESSFFFEFSLYTLEFGELLSLSSNIYCLSDGSSGARILPRDCAPCGKSKSNQQILPSAFLPANWGIYFPEPLWVWNEIKYVNVARTKCLSVSDDSLLFKLGLCSRM